MADYKRVFGLLMAIYKGKMPHFATVTYIHEDLKLKS